MPGVALRQQANSTIHEAVVSHTGDVIGFRESLQNQQVHDAIVVTTLLVKFGINLVFGLGKLAVKKWITEPLDWQREMQWYSALLERANFGNIPLEAPGVEKALEHLSASVTSKTAGEFAAMRESTPFAENVSFSDVTQADTQTRGILLAEVGSHVGTGFSDLMLEKHDATSAKESTKEEGSDLLLESNDGTSTSGSKHGGEHSTVAEVGEVVAHTGVHLAVEEAIFHSQEENIRHATETLLHSFTGAEVASQSVDSAVEVISWSSLPLGMLVSLFQTDWGTSANSKERFAEAFGSVIGQLIGSLNDNLAGNQPDASACSLVYIYKDLEDRLICWAQSNAQETVHSSWAQSHADGVGLDAPPTTMRVDRDTKDDLPGASERFVKRFRTKVSQFAKTCDLAHGEPPNVHRLHLSMQSLESRGLCKLSGNPAVSCDPQRAYVRNGNWMEQLDSKAASNFVSNLGYVCLNPEGCHGGFAGGFKWCTVSSKWLAKGLCAVMGPEWTCGDLSDTWDRCGSPCSQVVEA